MLSLRALWAWRPRDPSIRHAACTHHASRVHVRIQLRSCFALGSRARLVCSQRLSVLPSHPSLAAAITLPVRGVVRASVALSARLLVVFGVASWVLGTGEGRASHGRRRSSGAGLCVSWRPSRRLSSQHSPALTEQRTVSCQVARWSVSAAALHRFVGVGLYGIATRWPCAAAVTLSAADGALSFGVLGACSRAPHCGAEHRFR